MSESFRDRLLGDLGERHEKLLAVIDDALVAKKLIWVSCPACKKRSEVEVADSRAAIAAAEFFANQAAGRPGVDDRASTDEERILFVRVVDGSDAAVIWRVAESFVPADRLEEFGFAVAEAQRAAGREPRAATWAGALDQMAELAEKASGRSVLSVKSEEL